MSRYLNFNRDFVYNSGIIEDEPTTPLPPPAEFYVYDKQNMPCLLITLDATLIIEPKRKERDAKV